MEESKNHTQLPNGMLNIKDLSPKDLIVYMTIKRHLDKDSLTSTISYETIAKKLGCSERTVRNSVTKLKQQKYITVRKSGKCNCYSFAPCTHYETFSWSFIDNPEMTYQQKAFYASQQQYMFQDEHICKTTYDAVTLGNKLNLDFKTVKKYEKEFMDKGWMIEAPTKAKDSTTGCSKIEKIYFPNKFGQLLAAVAVKHENALRVQEAKLANTDSRVEKLEQYIQSLQKDIQILANAVQAKNSQAGLILE